MLDDEVNGDKLEDMDNNVVNGPTVLAHVELARTVRKYISLSRSLVCFDLKTLLQIANFPLLISLRKLASLTSLNMFDDSSMISYILTATSLHLAYL